jgi:hypothetical protein
MSKRTSYGKIYRPNVRARPRLSRGRDFTCQRNLPSAQTQPSLRANTAHPHRRNLASTWTRRVHADASQRPRRQDVSVRTRAASMRTHSFPPLPSPPLPSLPFPPPLRTRTIEKNLKIILFIYLFLFLVVATILKREKKNFSLRFSIPKIPELHELPKLRRRSREKKVFSA